MIAIRQRDLLLLIGITFIWGVNLITSKVGVSEIPPILFTVLRFAIVALVLVPVLRIHHGQMGTLAIAAMLTGALNFGLNFAGLRRASNVSSVAIMTQLSVPFTTLLSVAMLGEVVRWRRRTGIALSFLGVIIMGFDPQIGDRWESVALVVASAFCGALGLIIVKRLQGFTPAEILGWTSLISLPALIGASLLLEHPNLGGWGAISWQAWGALLFSAIVASLIAHTGYFHLVQRYPVTSVAPLTTLSPVFSIVLGVALLGDHLTWRITIGGACTLIGVLIITLRERRIVDTGV
ncbi:MAG TPA: DMT family transporter [Steroidobacteraceae bacterium]|nr:DMT family transporter [Steroidobacteraceae bacterium]